jgi:hypothetical protein
MLESYNSIEPVQFAERLRGSISAAARMAAAALAFKRLLGNRAVRTIAPAIDVVTGVREVAFRIERDRPQYGIDSLPVLQHCRDCGRIIRTCILDALSEGLNDGVGE